MTNKAIKLNSIDFYDYEALEKLHQSRSKKYINFVKKWREAKDQNDKNAAQKAFKGMQKHKKQDEVIKTKCEESGYCW